MRLSITRLVNITFIFSSLVLSNNAIASSHHAGATLGSLSVDGIGSANYAIDIQVPPGTAGMQPSLSL